MGVGLRNITSLVYALLATLFLRTGHLVGAENHGPANPPVPVSSITADTISDAHRKWVVEQCDLFRGSFMTQKNCDAAVNRFEGAKKILRESAAITSNSGQSSQAQEESLRKIFPIIASLKVRMPGLVEEVDVTISPVPEKNTIQPQWLWEKYRKYCPAQKVEKKKVHEESMLIRMGIGGLIGVVGLVAVGMNPLTMFMNPSPLMSAFALPTAGLLLLNKACQKLFDWAEDAEHKNLDDEDKKCRLAEEESKFSEYIRDVFRAVRDSYGAKMNEEYVKELMQGVTEKYDELVAVHQKKGELFDKSLPILKAVIGSLPSEIGAEIDTKHSANQFRSRVTRSPHSGSNSSSKPSAPPESPTVVTMDINSRRATVFSTAASPRPTIQQSISRIKPVSPKRKLAKKKSEWRWAKPSEIIDPYSICKKCKNTGQEGVLSMGIGSICTGCGAYSYQINKNNPTKIRMALREKLIAKYKKSSSTSKKSCLCEDKRNCSHTN